MLYIPQELTVGFKKIEESFTGKKGFITYRELGSKTNKLFNQSAFEGWVENSKENIQIDNKPRTGFIINKKMTHNHSYFGQINTILIYHPDGFEFEISLYNLMQILEHSDVNAQEIKQECVIGWYKSYPYLITTNCEEYKNAKSQNSTILEVTDMNKDLVPGRSYYSKKEKDLVYIGKHDILKIESFKTPHKVSSRTGHVFLKNKSDYVVLAKCQAAYSTDIHPEFDKYLERYIFSQSTIKFKPDGVNLVAFPASISPDSFQDIIRDRILSILEHSTLYSQQRFEFHQRRVVYIPQSPPKFDENSSEDTIAQFKQQLFEEGYKEYIRYIPQYLSSVFNDNLAFDIWSEKLQRTISLEFHLKSNNEIYTKAYYPVSHKHAFVTKKESDIFFESRHYSRNDSSHLSQKDLDIFMQEYSIPQFLQKIHSLIDESYLRNNIKDLDFNTFYQPIYDFFSNLIMVGYQYSETEGFENAFMYSTPFNLDSEYLSPPNNLELCYDRTSHHSVIVEKSKLKLIKTIPFHK